MTARRVQHALLFGPVLTLAAACNAILGIDPPNRIENTGGQGGNAARGGSAAQGGDAAQGGGSTSSGTGGGAGGGSADAGTCPADMRRVSKNGTSFCIDVAEVTVAEYSQFLAAKNGDVSGQPAACAFNTTFAQHGIQGEGDAPVTWVNWCDAYGYCAWAGKRLCGKIGGGPTPSGSPGDPTVSQWLFACSGAGNSTYPYGDIYDPAACNGEDLGANKALPASSLPQCVGGFPDLANMSGNVVEWEDCCEFDAGMNDSCEIRGGSFEKPSDQLTCGFLLVAARSFVAQDAGLRCCAD